MVMVMGRGWRWGWGWRWRWWLRACTHRWDGDGARLARLLADMGVVGRLGSPADLLGQEKGGKLKGKEKGGKLKGKKGKEKGGKPKGLKGKDKGVPYKARPPSWRGKGVRPGWGKGPGGPSS